MAIIIVNNHIGIIVQLDLPNPKFLIIPLFVNKNPGFKYTITTYIIINNITVKLLLCFLTKDNAIIK